jgi:pSer/pThr/pTyr-binding forkhead associated (FHA) protein
MIYCQRCLHELPDGTIFCDVCGTSLLPESPYPSILTPPSRRPEAPFPEVGAPAPSRPVGQAYAASVPGWSRPESPFPEADILPKQRGSPAPLATDLTPSTPPRTIRRAEADEQAHVATDAGVTPGRIPSASGGHLRLRLRLTTGKTFELAGKPRYLIGRRDPETHSSPDVDLADFNGAASGVSRQHAALHVASEGVFIEDLESLNETIRNGYRLLPRQRYPLADGDELRLGSITLLVVIS